MNKKKVKKLIEKAISVNLNNLVIGNNEHNAPINRANALLSEAIKELSKSDWISVEDRLPEYEEYVLVCNKEGRFLVDYRSTPQDYNDDNGFVKRFHVTHWKPIEKLEE